MNNLHDKLLSSSPAYAKWHKHPSRNVHHFAVFAIVALLMTGAILSGIHALALSYDETTTKTATSTPGVLAAGKASQHLPILTTQLLQAIKLYKRTSPADKSAALINLLAAARARKQAFLNGAETDPQAVLLSSLPAELSKRLPSEISTLLEHQVSEKGKITVIHVDCDTTPGQSEISNCHDQTLFYITTSHGKISLHFAEDVTGESVPSNFLTDDYVKAQGVEVGDKLVLHTKDLGSDTLSSQTLSGTFGAQSTLVILVNFQDLTTQPFSTSSIYSTVFDSIKPGVSGFNLENSFQQTNLTGAVAGWYTIPVSSTTCNTSGIQSYGNQAAQAAGYNLSNYKRFLYIFPNISACTWAGYSYIGGSPSYSWSNGGNSLRVIGHELGHAFGLYHSHSLSCGTAVYASSGCSISEYGDMYDIMGGTYPDHLNASQKERLGWLNYGTEPPIQTVTTSGNYTIAPYESNDTGVKALKVLQSSGANLYYYIEFRAGMGYDGNLAGTPVTNGVVIHISSPSNSNSSDLLNMTPGGSWSYPQLSIGKSYTDPATGVTFTAVSANSTGATVNVNFGSIACVQTIPGISINPSTQTGSAGATLSYTVNVTNNNSGCSTSTFNLAATNIPAGFTANFSSPSLTISSGSSTTTTLSLTSPAGFADSSNIFNVSATDSMNSSSTASTQATYVVYTMATDTTSPTVSITNPIDGSNIAGLKSLTIQATAADNVGVTKVEFYVDGILKTTDNSFPYSYKWVINKTLYSGLHTITAKAYDSVGNNSSASVTVHN